MFDIKKSRLSADAAASSTAMAVVFWTEVTVDATEAADLV